MFDVCDVSYCCSLKRCWIVWYAFGQLPPCHPNSPVFFSTIRHDKPWWLSHFIKGGVSFGKVLYTLHFPLSSCNWETSQRKPQTYFKLNHSGQPKSNPILQQPALWILIKVKLFLKDLQIFRSFCHDSWCRPKRLQLKAQPPGSFEGCIGSFKATRLGKWPKISNIPKNIPKNIHIYKTYKYKSEWSWTAGIWSY